MDSKRLGQHVFLMLLVVIADLSQHLAKAQDGSGVLDGQEYTYYTAQDWTFDQAEDHCKTQTNNEGHVAEITSQSIQDYFADTLIAGGANMWIGAKKIGGSFTWIYSNTPADVSSVIGNGNGKDCVFFRADAKWKAGKCSTDSKGVICARPATESSPSPTPSMAETKAPSVTAAGAAQIASISTSATGSTLSVPSDPGNSRLPTFMKRLIRGAVRMQRDARKARYSTLVPLFQTTTASGCQVDCANIEVLQISTHPSASAAVPGPDPDFRGNVSQVLHATQNSSRFASPDFVSRVEAWLVQNDEIPDDFDEGARFDYAKDFIGVCNNVFDADLVMLNQTEAASIFADSCSNVAQDLTSDLGAGETLDISKSNIDVHAAVQTTLNFTGFVHSFEGEDENDTDDDQVISISQSIVDDLGLTGDDTIGITVVSYKNGHYISGHDNDTIETNDRPAGPVVSIAVAVNNNITSVPVTFRLPNYLAHLDIKNDVELGVDNFKCVFFDQKSDGRGEWSDFGCQVQDATRNFTVCACNHTTHFGVLLQVIEAPPLRAEDELALSLITYIVGGVSLACLLVTLVVLNYLSSLTSDRVRIHKNLVGALTVAQTLFLCVSFASRHDISCRLVTLSLHYFYLAVFSWSLLEGVNLYVQIVKVFSTGKSAKYWHYLLFGWGIPVPIVATSAAVRWPIYGANGICWPTFEKGLSWSFAGPVAVVILMNFIILLMVVRIIVASAAAVKTDNFEHIKAGVKGALLLVPILGLSWVFGFLSLGGANIVFTYVFVIAVALQGVLIFLLYCVFNSEVRAALKRKSEKRKLRRGDGISTGPTPSTSRSKESNETSSTFTSRLLERMKRRKSLVTDRRSPSPVDTIHLVDRSGYAHSTKDVKLMHKRQGSTDSGYSQNPNHTQRTLPSDSMASIRTESLADEFVPPHTPTYENEIQGVP